MEEHQIIVDVDYNLLLIQDPLETRLLGVAAEGERRFLRTEPDRVVIHTGQWGPVAVTVQVRDTAPSPVDEQFRSRWEDIAARSFITSSEDMRLGSITGGHVPDIDTLTLAGPGSYRIRAAAVGRTRVLGCGGTDRGTTGRENAVAGVASRAQQSDSPSIQGSVHRIHRSSRRVQTGLRCREPLGAWPRPALALRVVSLTRGDWLPIWSVLQRL